MPKTEKPDIDSSDVQVATEDTPSMGLVDIVANQKAILKHAIDSFKGSSLTSHYMVERQNSFNQLFENIDIQVWSTKEFVEGLFSVFGILTESNRATVFNVAIQLISTGENTDLHIGDAHLTKEQSDKIFSTTLKQLELGVIKSDDILWTLRQQERNLSQEQCITLREAYMNCKKSEEATAYAEQVDNRTAALLENDFVSIAEALVQESKKPHDLEIPLNKDKMTEGLNENTIGESIFCKIFRNCNEEQIVAAIKYGGDLNQIPVEELQQKLEKLIDIELGEAIEENIESREKEASETTDGKTEEASNAVTSEVANTSTSSDSSKPSSSNENNDAEVANTPASNGHDGGDDRGGNGILSNFVETEPKSPITLTVCDTDTAVKMTHNKQYQDDNKSIQERKDSLDNNSAHVSITGMMIDSDNEFEGKMQNNGAFVYDYNRTVVELPVPVVLSDPLSIFSNISALELTDFGHSNGVDYEVSLSGSLPWFGSHPVSA